MTKYLLDSNALIDWLNGREPVPKRLEELSSRGEILAVNAISLTETYSGIVPSDLDRIESLLAAFEYWPIDSAVCKLAGAYRHEYASAGRKLAVADVILGAHALSEDATLITDNVRDFPMRRLKILNLRG